MTLVRNRTDPLLRHDDGHGLFGEATGYQTERSTVFGVCAVLLLIRMPTFCLWPSIDGWALVINALRSITCLWWHYFDVTSPHARAT